MTILEQALERAKELLIRDERDGFGGMTEVQTYTATIFIAGDYARAKAACQNYCLEGCSGLCVTIEPTEYVYTGGCEAGVRVGLINYPRFPADSADIFSRAMDLARVLRVELGQWSFSIVATDKTVFETVRVDAPSPAIPTPSDGAFGRQGSPATDTPNTSGEPQ